MVMAKRHGIGVIVGSAVAALALAFGGGVSPASAAAPVVRDSGRVVVYYQKQFVNGSTGAYISPLPLVTEHTGVDVVNLAAVHMNAGELKLNDLLPDDPSFDTMWAELR